MGARKKQITKAAGGGNRLENRSVSSADDAITINEPWRLDLPQEILDHYAHTSAMTGIDSCDLIAATIREHYSATAGAVKKNA